MVILDKDSLELGKDSLELDKLSVEKEIKKFDIEIALVKKQLELSRLLEKLYKVKYLGD